MKQVELVELVWKLTFHFTECNEFIYVFFFTLELSQHYFIILEDVVLLIVYSPKPTQQMNNNATQKASPNHRGRSSEADGGLRSWRRWLVSSNKGSSFASFLACIFFSFLTNFFSFFGISGADIESSWDRSFSITSSIWIRFSLSRNSLLIVSSSIRFRSRHRRTCSLFRARSGVIPVSLLCAEVLVLRLWDDDDDAELSRVPDIWPFRSRFLCRKPEGSLVLGWRGYQLGVEWMMNSYFILRRTLVYFYYINNEGTLLGSPQGIHIDVPCYISPLCVCISHWLNTIIHWQCIFGVMSSTTCVSGNPARILTKFSPKFWFVLRSYPNFLVPNLELKRAVSLTVMQFRT